MKNPLIVALDVDDEVVARKLVGDLIPYVGGFKIGPRLTFRLERSFIKEISQNSLLFFDHKFFDIPTTTVSSVRVAAELGAHWVTVHGLNGPECLRQLREVELEIKKTVPQFRVVTVTVLTSFTESNLPPIWNKEPILESVLKLAGTALDAGLESLVCSPLEIESLKKRWPDSFLIAPGIRLPGDDAGDQKRTATPLRAKQNGASALVVGRPIISSSDPKATAKSIVDSLEAN